MTPKVITESTTEPILLAEAAGNLLLDPDDTNSPPGYVQGSRIQRLITAARKACEQELEMSLVAKTLEIAYDSFAGEIELQQGPVRSIVSVTYKDSAGADTVLAGSQYRFSSYDEAPILQTAYNVTWPSGALTDKDSVRVRYTVGYPSTDSPAQTVPEPIRHAMHLLISHWFANRDAVDLNTLAEVPRGVKDLLSTWRKGLGV